MSLSEVTKQFTHYCRTGQLHPALDVNPHQIKFYFDHAKKNVIQTLENVFPLALHLLVPDQWELLTSDFFVNQEMSSPFLWKMPLSFVEFVKRGNWSQRFDLPYLNDLLHFEWVEIEVFMMPDQPKRSQKKVDPLDAVLYLNQESRLLSYSYPVFEKKPLPRQMDKSTYPLFVFRHPIDCQVRFIALSSFFKDVLEQIQSQPCLGRDVLISSAKKFALEETMVLEKGKSFLSNLLSQSAING